MKVSFILLVAITSLSSSARAQRHPLAVDLTAGIGTGRGGFYVDRTAFDAELTVAPAHAGLLVGALTAGVRASPGSSDVCLLPADPHQGCAPRFPSGGHVGVMGGAELSSGFVGIRALTGPALFRVGSETLVGGQLSVDASAGSAHVALVVAGRLSVFGPDDVLNASAIEFGLRLR